VLEEAILWRENRIAFGKASIMTGQNHCRWQVEGCRRLQEAIDTWMDAGQPMPEDESDAKISGREKREEGREEG
jgi:hypothetical protein